MKRARLRELGINVGVLPPGEFNAITDVAGVQVGQATLVYDQPRVARTGVTMILPRAGAVWNDHCYAAYHSFNGKGELTGTHWISESGMLCFPIALTTTQQVGTVHEAMVRYGKDEGLSTIYSLAVVGETYDGFLNDSSAFHVTAEHVRAALADASSGPVREGNTGGGTGMICHDFKGGTGTASRLVEIAGELYTVGALVQANYGSRADFRIDGVPVGRLIGSEQIPLPGKAEKSDGSIIIVVATDAPLLPGQCKRLAQRATVGLARVGGHGHNGSGDLFLAFSTGNHLPIDADAPFAVQTLPNQLMNPLFNAVAEAVEEAILNALTAAETMTGYKGRMVHALPLEGLKELIDRYRPVE
ncbi:MAG TPA: P1 family peptidase [Anaerolineae bacterium]|nr:P1 family peptidase [Anaerolineae bacterium]